MAEKLYQLRDRLDDVDTQIQRLILSRFSLVREIGAVKKEGSIGMMQPKRVTFVRDRYIRFGMDNEIPDPVCQRIAEALIEGACDVELEIIDGPTRKN